MDVGLEIQAFSSHAARVKGEVVISAAPQHNLDDRGARWRTIDVGSTDVR